MSKCYFVLATINAGRLATDLLYCSRIVGYEGIKSIGKFVPIFNIISFKPR
jgi:hypothetical protein